ncbi:MAG: CotH kinase family protein [Bacteroidetes bacterium]|nr:CotH kinase family protein [Bacteroidota bacterium]
MKKQWLFLALICLVLELEAQSFYDLNILQKIEIYFAESNWDYKLDTAKAGAESYIMAQKVIINGIAFDSVGVKYKGNSTYRATQIKNPFHIELDTYKDQDYQGYTDIKLSNSAKDPSFLREVLSYDILRKYMPASLCNYANVYVNGIHLGLYPNAESVTKKFVSKHFNSSKNAFFKCNPIAGAGPGTSAKPNLVYLGKDSSVYYPAYEMKSDNGWNELISLCDILNNRPQDIEKILNIDRTLWMLAFDNLFVNLDSYIGGFAQNYYLYKDNSGRFNPIVWDLNESFGTFSQTGTLNLMNTSSKQQMTHLLHINDTAWPLIQKLLSNPQYKRMYVAHIKTMMEENFLNGSYYEKAQAIQKIINNDVLADLNKFFPYNQYQSNITSDVSSGMSNAPGIKSLMDGRANFLLSQADFKATAPSISNIKLSTSSPEVNSKLFITSTVTNSTEVILAYRFSRDKPFSKIKLLDDGLHGDGISGDKVFGIDLIMGGVFMEYYFYSENENAGIFSPLRAEHEFYTLYAKLTNIVKGDLVINEFMADNGTTKADANGQFDDWIELYNNTNNTLSLSNLYMSDSYSSPLKWKFPDSIVIAPKGYLVVWTDEDLTQPGIHAGFKLSASGEKILLSYANGYVVDSITFAPQLKDISFCRCPNGTGNFKSFKPSFGTENCVTTVGNKELNKVEYAIYPNPGYGIFYIKNENSGIKNIRVFNALGSEVLNRNTSMDDLIQIDLNGHIPGVYYILANGVTAQKILLK